MLPGRTCPGALDRAMMRVGVQLTALSGLQAYQGVLERRVREEGPGFR